jgi:hypothetical protein
VIRVLKWVGGFLGGGFLNRALNSVDTYIESTTDKERIKADVVRSYYANRTSWMQAGGFWLLLMFAVPVAVWFGAVTLYNLLWCAGCAYPQEWTIAAYPAPLDEWAGWIVLACIGGAGAFAWKR